MLNGGLFRGLKPYFDGKKVENECPARWSKKTSAKTSGKILTALAEDVNLTIPELAALIDVTERSIERNIKKLQDQCCLSRVGPVRGGPLGDN